MLDYEENIGDLLEKLGIKEGFGISRDTLTEQEMRNILSEIRNILPQKIQNQYGLDSILQRAINHATVTVGAYLYP